MALFGRKDKTVTCAICGTEEKTGFFRGLRQKEVAGKFVCDQCYGVVDVPKSKLDKMSLEEFSDYRAFRAENQKLKDGFKITSQVDFGASSALYFDVDKRLMCLSKNLNTTIFEAKHIMSFEIKEDSFVLIEGSEKGLVRHESNIRNQVMAMIPELRYYQTEMILYQDRLAKAPEDKKDEVYKSKPDFRLHLPFEEFVISIHLNHPYWDSMCFKMSAPQFDKSYPDVNDYLNAYNQQIAVIEKLAKSLMTMAFPEAKDLGSADAKPVVAAPAAVADPIAELKRYKELLDMGIITQDEFDAKKEQLLGL